ncbi:MAG: carbohydrate kinase family protein [Candidatus Nanopelagicales bacterium]
MQKASLVIGEALVDEVTDLSGGQKRIFGGSPANTALALSRLRIKSYFKGRISQDSTGQQIKKYLIESGVDLTPSIEVEDRALIIEAKIQGDGSANYFADLTGCSDFGWRDDELTTDLPKDVEVIHLGSLAAAVEPGASAIERWIENVKSRRLAGISFDPNIRPNLVSDPIALKARVERIVALSDIVKLSHEDLEWLDEKMSNEAIARRWLSLGAGAVIVTQAQNGATLYLDNGIEFAFSAKKINLVDTIGAGDTFTAATLTQLLEGNLLSRHGLSPDIAETVWIKILQNSLSTAAITCSRSGANPPNRSEVDW